MRQRTLLILSAVALFLASCGKKTGDSGLLVPKDAAMVLHVNSKSLNSKISWEEIKATSWYSQLSKQAEDTMAKQLLADPAKSGVDIKDDMVFYMKKQGRGGYSVFIGSLSNASAFETMLKEMHKKEAVEIKKEGDFSYMHVKDVTTVWNSGKFATVSNVSIPDTKTMMQGRGGDDDYDGYRSSFKFSADSLRMFAQQALTLKPSDNLDTDARFASLVKDGSDFHMWFNVGKFYPDMSGGMMSMMKLGVLFEGNITAVSANFDNGKISAKSKQYFGEEMSKVMAKHKGGPVTAEVINRIPSLNVAAVIAVNFPPQGLHEILKITGVDGLANGFLAQMNYSVEEFIKAGKGEMLFAVTDVAPNFGSDSLRLDTTVQGPLRSKPDMNMIFATTVNDKASFEKLVTLIWQSSKGMTDKMPEVSYKVTDNWFAISNKPEFTDQFLAGGSNKFAFTDRITGHPTGVYLDINKLIRTFGGAATDSSSKAAVDASLAMWQDVVATGGDFKDNALHYEFEINLVDKNTNSLKQLNQYFDKMFLLKKPKKHDMADWKMDEEVRMDSVATVSPN